MATDSFASITKGFNDANNHTELQSKYTDLIVNIPVPRAQGVISMLRIDHIKQP